MRGDFEMTSDELPDFAEADRDLLQRVKGFLHQRGYSPHRTLALSIERGVVVVQGRVPTYYLRQVAVECIKRVAGVTQVLDRIEVVYVPDCPVEERPADEPETSTILAAHRVDLPALTRTMQNTSQSNFRRRQLLTSAKG